MSSIDTLLTIAREFGIPARKQGASWGSHICPSCGESSNRQKSNKLCFFVGKDGRARWNCFACGERGDAADLVAMVTGCTIREALRKIRDYSPNAVTPGSKLKHRKEIKLESARTHATQLAVAEVVERLREHGMRYERAAFNYLVNSRGIPKEIVKEAVERGMIRFLPSDPFEAMKWLDSYVGYSLMFKSGMLKPGKRMSAYAFKPLIFLPPKGGRYFEGSVIGSVGPNEHKRLALGLKNIPFWWRGENPHGVTMVVEGMIDLLSVVALGFRGYGVIGLPSVTCRKPEWFPAVAARSGNPTILIATDANKAGDLAAEKIAEMCTQANLNPVRKRPKVDDWNVLLRQQQLQSA